MGKNSKFIDTYLKLRENRVGFAAGGFSWGENSPMAGGNASGLLSLGSGLVDAIDPGDQWGYRSDGGAIASGALKGASMGAALGPWGMAGGAVVGGIVCVKNSVLPYNLERGQFDEWMESNRVDSVFVCDNWE